MNDRRLVTHTFVSVRRDTHIALMKRRDKIQETSPYRRISLDDVIRDFLKEAGLFK